MLAALERIEIGDHVMFANGCFVGDAAHRFDDPDQPITWQGFTSKGPVRIGSNCWFGVNCVVTSGVEIGERCVIGANSVVTQDLPPRVIAAGVPAKVIKEIEFKRRRPVMGRVRDDSACAARARCRDRRSPAFAGCGGDGDDDRRPRRPTLDRRPRADRPRATTTASGDGAATRAERRARLKACAHLAIEAVLDLGRSRSRLAARYVTDRLPERRLRRPPGLHATRRCPAARATGSTFKDPSAIDGDRATAVVVPVRRALRR